jgi:hypothetical protein
MFRGDNNLYAISADPDQSIPAFRAAFLWENCSIEAIMHTRRRSDRFFEDTAFIEPERSVWMNPHKSISPRIQTILPNPPRFWVSLSVFLSESCPLRGRFLHLGMAESGSSLILGTWQRWARVS